MSEQKIVIFRCPLCGGLLELGSRKPVQSPEFTILDPEAPITDRQMRCIFAICKKKGLPAPEHLSEWTKGQASAWIQEHV